MYSLSGRLNTIAFNTLMYLAVLAGLNFLSSFPFGGLNTRQPKIITPFTIKDYDAFMMDRYINEDAISFTFDFEADLRPLFNWNTNLIFAYISCQFNTTRTKVNQVTIWDQRVPRDRPEDHIISL